MQVIKKSYTYRRSKEINMVTLTRTYNVLQQHAETKNAFETEEGKRIVMT
jgi:hypothetical protein